MKRVQDFVFCLWTWLIKDVGKALFYNKKNIVNYLYVVENDLNYEFCPFGNCKYILYQRNNIYTRRQWEGGCQIISVRNHFIMPKYIRHWSRVFVYWSWKLTYRRIEYMWGVTSHTHISRHFHLSLLRVKNVFCFNDWIQDFQVLGTKS